MSNSQNKTCIGCHVTKNFEEFLNEKGDVLTKCSKCRNNLKMAYLKNKIQGPIISHMNITEVVYNSLISLNNTNDFYERENEALKNLDFEIGRRIIASISEGDGYSWVYRDKKLGKRQAKHPILEKQRDTPPFLDHVETSLEIKKFIKDNIYCSPAKICHQICENQINGYECITIQQTYYWWMVESRKLYCQHSDSLLSLKLLLEEFNLEIIVDHFNSPIPALGFLTTLFYRLIYNKFDAIEIDATYSTNNLSWELYAIMGIIDSTGFPLSYLLISAGKNRNITRILTCWMQALKKQYLNNFSLILSDKDFSEINSVQAVWSEACVQLCMWHVRRAIKQRLASNKISVYYSYNPRIAYEECSLIDPDWGFVDNSNSAIFCPLNLHKTIIEFIKDHSSRHILLPKSDGSFVVQRNGYYPLISTYEGKLVNIFDLENLQNSQNHKISSALLSQDKIIEHEDDYIIESSDEEQDAYELELAYLYEVLDKTKKLLEESRNKPKRHLWLKKVRPNFKSLEKMNSDILSLDNRKTMPKTWQDFNNNT
ncbi:24256_t:CDS:2, partial [Gigaspora margarita]